VKKVLSVNRSQFIKIFGFITIGVIYGISAYTYLNFAFSYTINILYPFDAIVFLGAFFMLVYSAIGLFSTVGSRERNTAFYMEIIIAIIAIIELIVAILAIPAMNYPVQLTPFNAFIASSCVLGVILGGIGLLFFITNILDIKL
jgi:hypothetical protein